MDNVANIIDVHATRVQSQPSQADLRRSFGSCGTIICITPWRSSTSDKEHNFIEFDTPEAASEAYLKYRDNPAFHVSTLRTDPILRERYRTVVSDYTTSSEQSVIRPVRRLVHRYSNSRYRERIPQPYSTLNHRISSPEIRESTAQRPLGSSPTSVNLPLKQEPSPTHRNRDAIITLKFEGHSVPYDLEHELTDNPDSVILLLRKCNDRASWMMVGAQYRRNRNLLAAEKVMQAFISWTGERGDEFDLKPAFLFLSTLYTDQCKASAASLKDEKPWNDAATQNYLKTAAYYASIAHGIPPQIPTPQHLDAEKENIDPRNCIYASSATLEYKCGQGFVPRSLYDRLCSSRDASTEENQSRANCKSRANDSPPHTMPFSTSATELDRTTFRAEKRSLEQDVMVERSVRRKLEKTLKETRDELHRANQITESMHSQVKREVDSRRKVEAEMMYLVESAKTREADLRNEASKSAFLQIASALTNAANMDKPDGAVLDLHLR